MDYITYDTKGIWRCYEVKVSKSDFYSKSKKTFVGHYNYFVLTKELFKIVKEDIPNHVGVYVNGSNMKRARKQELPVDEQVLKDSMIRSLTREFNKQFRSGNSASIEILERQLRRIKKEKDNYRKKYQDLMKIGREKYGDKWYIK